MGTSASGCKKASKAAAQQGTHRHAKDDCSHPHLLTGMLHNHKRKKMGKSVAPEPHRCKQFDKASSVTAEPVLGRCEPPQKAVEEASTKNGSQRLYSMAELLAMQDLELRQQGQQPHQGLEIMEITSMRELWEAERRKDPAEKQQGSLHQSRWSQKEEQGRPTVQSMQHQHQGRQPATACQQHADSHAPQQGLQFAAQHRRGHAAW